MIFLSLSGCGRRALAALMFEMVVFRARGRPIEGGRDVRVGALGLDTFVVGAGTLQALSAILEKVTKLVTDSAGLVAHALFSSLVAPISVLIRAREMLAVLWPHVLAVVAVFGGQRGWIGGQRGWSNRCVRACFPGQNLRFLPLRLLGHEAIPPVHPFPAPFPVTPEETGFCQVCEVIDTPRVAIVVYLVRHRELEVG